jgi:hypothetical protein
MQEPFLMFYKAHIKIRAVKKQGSVLDRFLHAFGNFFNGLTDLIHEGLMNNPVNRYIYEPIIREVARAAGEDPDKWIDSWHSIQRVGATIVVTIAATVATGGQSIYAQAAAGTIELSAATVAAAGAELYSAYRTGSLSYDQYREARRALDKDAEKLDKEDESLFKKGEAHDYEKYDELRKWERVATKITKKRLK